MNHFTLGDWIDFVRNLKSRSVTSRMQHHLDEGCRPCQKAVRIWQELFSFASNERRYAPPDRALRSARGYFGALKPRKRGSRVAVIARLLFDSLLEPAPVGIRSSQPPPRQLVYAARNLLIDLRLERRSGRLSIAGQAQPRSGLGPEMTGTEVLVLQEKKALARTKCNQFGEFQFDLEPEAGEDLSLILRGPKPCVVPLRLAGLMPGETAT
jgi:hypothetical protein